jgi:hypothetical protein
MRAQRGLGAWPCLSAERAVDDVSSRVHKGGSGTFGDAPREPTKDRKDETARADLSDGRRTDGPERGGGISGSDDAAAGVPLIDAHHL